MAADPALPPRRFTTIEASTAADLLASFAKGEPDGCFAVSSEFVGSHPGTVVLVSTVHNPERLRLLEALHESWYPEDEEL